MDVGIDEFLGPVSEEAPCGPDVRELADFDALRAVFDALDKASEGPPAQVMWSREQERILRLAQQAHDLRVWVWLARSWLVTDGLAGFARGLELLATGLERYWDALPPFDPEDSNPRERFMGRSAALSGIAGSSFQTSDKDLLRRRSTMLFLEELGAAVAKAPRGGAGAVLAGRIEAALGSVERLFKERFGANADPQLGFAEVLRRLAVLNKPQGTATDAAEDVAAAYVPNGAGAVSSRAEVVAALDQVLDYYARHEPSSPVPLLVGRAKRLVAMSFLDAIRELAPGGLKELQAVAGADEPKPTK
jgi:type VI secretion system protein ImpA